MTKLSMHAISAPVFTRMLNNLSSILSKAEQQAKVKGYDPSVLMNDRLAPDMFTLTRQIQIATDHAKGCMARLAGKTPERDIKIAFTGLRPGEKLREELLHANEDLVPTSATGIMLASPRTSDLKLLARAFDDLERHARTGATDDALALLKHLVPEYLPAANGAATESKAAT